MKIQVYYSSSCHKLIESVWHMKLRSPMVLVTEGNLNWGWQWLSQSFYSMAFFSGLSNFYDSNLICHRMKCHCTVSSLYFHHSISWFGNHHAFISSRHYELCCSIYYCFMGAHLYLFCQDHKLTLWVHYRFCFNLRFPFMGLMINYALLLI